MQASLSSRLIAALTFLTFRQFPTFYHIRHVDGTAVFDDAHSFEEHHHVNHIVVVDDLVGAEVSALADRFDVFSGVVLIAGSPARDDFPHRVQLVPLDVVP